MSIQGGRSQEQQALRVKAEAPEPKARCQNHKLVPPTPMVPDSVCSCSRTQALEATRDIERASQDKPQKLLLADEAGDWAVDRR
jgi:hypothetical protein